MTVWWQCWILQFEVDGLTFRCRLEHQRGLICGLLNATVIRNLSQLVSILPHSQSVIFLLHAVRKLRVHGCGGGGISRLFNNSLCVH